MDKGAAIILTVIAGGMAAMQAPINAGLSRATGGFPAALISFAVGTLLLALIVVVSGRAGELGGASTVPWYYLIGGAFGVAYVTTALLTVPTIGAGGVAALIVTGQLSAAVAIDRLGLFGLDQVALSPHRLAGIVLLLAGTFLIVR